MYIALKANRLDLLGKNYEDIVTLTMLRGVLSDLTTDISNLCFNPNFETIKEKYFKETI